MTAWNGVAVPARIPTAACRCETLLGWYRVSRHAFFASGPTELIIFNASVDEHRLVGRLCGMWKF
jgi:hypothetical protein